MMSKLKKAFTVAIAMSIIICTACYPTGEKTIKNESSLTLSELNISSLPNVQFQFDCNKKYNTSYPLLNARFKSMDSLTEKIESIFLYDENNEKYINKEINKPSVYITSENSYNIYYLENNGHIMYDTGCISYIKNGIRSEENGYSEVQTIYDTLCAPEFMERFFSDKVLGGLDPEPLTTRSDDILKNLSVLSFNTPEIYAATKRELLSLPYVQADKYDGFDSDDEAYLIQYRQVFEGLPLSYFRSHSAQRETEGIQPFISFVYSRKGLELFNMDIIEVTEKVKDISVCSFTDAAAAVKAHIEALYSEDDEKKDKQLTVKGGELDYISEIDFDTGNIRLMPAWIFTSETVFDDGTPFFEPIIIDAANAQLYI